VKKSDIEIIQDCLNGNQSAYKQLYERYISYCYGICIRYAVNQTDIKDVVQIIFSQAFLSLHNYDSTKSKFKTWFTRVCINNILSYRKKQKNRLPIQDFEDINVIDLLNEDSINDNIDREYVLSIIKKMPDKYQIVFNMFVIDGYSHDEISKQLKISIASSRVILNRARGWMKKSFLNHLNS